MSTNRGLFNISILDFIEKGIEKYYFTRTQIKDTKINIQKLNLLEFINELEKQSFLKENQTYSILFDLTKNKRPLLRKNNNGTFNLVKENGTEELFNINIEIDKQLKPIYDESIEKYGFNSEKINIAIYKIDHINKKIYTLIPAPVNPYIYDKLKLIKDFEETKNEKRYHVKDNEGKEVLIKRKINDYAIKYYLAPTELINKIHSKNIKLGIKLTQKSKDFSEKKDNLGFVKEGYKKHRIKNGEGSGLKGFIQDILIEQEKRGGSDIHLEPELHSETDSGRVRIRVNGKLQSPSPIPGNFSSIVRDIKELSHLDINKKDIPQDGKLTIYIEQIDKELNYRVSTEPIGEHDQEKVVLRILSKDVSWLNLDSLKMDLEKREIIDNLIGNPAKDKKGKYRDGMILMTGPTGSGKSTTLFGILNQLNTTEVNIHTLEDPIEYELAGLNQSQIKGDYTYEHGLKACLRQDPDIILVGEIRDKETLEIAKSAAATGHLLLSSLHTNNTWETMTRLIGLGLDINMIGTIVRLIMAQRLGGVVCKKCKLEYNDPELALNSKEQEERESEYLRRKLEIYKKLIDSPYMEFLPSKIEDFHLYEGKGCPECDYTGEEGRIGLYEFLPITINIQKFLLEKGTKATKDDIGKLFKKEGITTLYQNAMLKTFKGFINENGEEDLITYNSAMAATGGDMYDFGEEYKDMDILELEHLLQHKKILGQIDKANNLLKEISFKIVGYEKQMNNSNKKEKYITLIEKLKNQEEKYKEILIKLEKRETSFN